MKPVKILLGVIAGLTVMTATQAQIRIGQTAGFTGPVAAGVKDMTAGAKLYFDTINARGGIDGKQIELVSLDDHFEPPLAAKNAGTLVADSKVVALFLSRGTPQTQAMLPVLEQAKIALVAPLTGAMLLRRPVQPYVFNVRASSAREAQRAVEHLVGVGVMHIAVVSPQDPSGVDAVAGATAGFDAAKIKPALLAQFDQQKPEFGPLVESLKKIDPQAILFVGSSQAVASGVKLLRTAGSRAQIVTLSNNASKGFIDAMAANAHGTIIAQVFPNEKSLSSPLIKEIIDFAKAAHVEDITPSLVEGFADAKVVVEAIKRAGRNPTRASVLTALNGMSAYDLGGLRISYSADDHTGLDFVDLSIVDSVGKLRR
jgi:ABC-type branched-subunit amino acid transport system substrate-binding protein